MKKVLVLVLTILLAFSLGGCIGATPDKEPGRVKCPACGHEFEPEMPAGG